jgi:hypothetical protein
MRQHDLQVLDSLCCRSCLLSSCAVQPESPLYYGVLVVAWALLLSNNPTFCIALMLLTSLCVISVAYTLSV